MDGKKEYTLGQATRTGQSRQQGQERSGKQRGGWARVGKKEEATSGQGGKDKDGG